MCSADERLKEQRNALVVTSHTGDLLWMPQAILRSSCSFDTLFFPFDEQYCVLKFGSWSYNGLKLDINFLPNRTSFDMLVSEAVVCLTCRLLGEWAFSACPLRAVCLVSEALVSL